MPRILLAGLLASVVATAASAQNTPGVTDSEIKIGQTMPYTGPAAALSAPGVAEVAYMKMINERGGIGGRRINLISADDGFMPWRTGNETRKLVELDRVAFIFGSIGTATQLAVANYLNEAKIPQLFIGSGAYRWGDYQVTPYTMGGIRPTYRIGARAYTRYILRRNPNARICLLYENDAFGRDYPAGVRDVLGDRYDANVHEATFELVDQSIDPQITRLKATGCDALIVAAVPQFVTQAIRKAYELAWKPIFFVANVSTSVPTVLEPAGLDKSLGILSSAWAKDPSDPDWADDAGMRDFKAWMAKYIPDADLRRPNFVQGYNYAGALMQVLKQAGSDLSRENIMRHATNLRGLELPMLLPGIKVNTSPNDYYAIQQLQLMRFDGKRWGRFGDLLTDEKTN